MPITSEELQAALAGLAATQPTAFADILGKALNLDAAALAGIVRVGAQAKLREEAQGLLAKVRASSALTLQAGRDEIEAKRREVLAPLEAAWNVRADRHASVIAKVEAIVAEVEAGKLNQLPSVEEVIEDMEK